MLDIKLYYLSCNTVDAFWNVGTLDEIEAIPVSHVDTQQSDIATDQLK